MPPLVQCHDYDVHLVLCDFGEYGTAYAETDPAKADRNTVIRDLIAGQYDRPLSVVALNTAEGWAHDVSESVARSILKAGAGTSLTAGTRAFVEAHLGELAQSR